MLCVKQEQLKKEKNLEFVNASKVSYELSVFNILLAFKRQTIGF